MTISVGDRKAAMKRVLVRLADLWGDERQVKFGPADLVEASPLGTTIDELEDAGLVKLVLFLSNPKPYVLTTEGWFKAHQVSGRFQSEEFHQRRGRLCAAMKRAVQERDDVALLDWRDLAQDADLPGGWVWNVFEAQVLHRLDSKRRYRMRFEDGIVWVPATFGQEPVDLDDL
jgi:hypothetical protein